MEVEGLMTEKLRNNYSLVPRFFACLAGGTFWRLTYEQVAARLGSGKERAAVGATGTYFVKLKCLFRKDV
jgi:hypothetical protein